MSEQSKFFKSNNKNQSPKQTIDLTLEDDESQEFQIKSSLRLPSARESITKVEASNLSKKSYSRNGPGTSSSSSGRIVVEPEMKKPTPTKVPTRIFPQDPSSKKISPSVASPYTPYGQLNFDQSTKTSSKQSNTGNLPFNSTNRNNATASTSGSSKNNVQGQPNPPHNPNLPLEQAAALKRLKFVKGPTAGDDPVTASELERDQNESDGRQAVQNLSVKGASNRKSSKPPAAPKIKSSTGNAKGKGKVESNGKGKQKVEEIVLSDSEEEEEEDEIEDSSEEKQLDKRVPKQRSDHDPIDLIGLSTGTSFTVRGSADIAAAERVAFGRLAEGTVKSRTKDYEQMVETKTKKSKIATSMKPKQKQATVSDSDEPGLADGGFDRKNDFPPLPPLPSSSQKLKPVSVPPPHKTEKWDATGTTEYDIDPPVLYGELNTAQYFAGEGSFKMFITCAQSFRNHVIKIKRRDRFGEWEDVLNFKSRNIKSGTNAANQGLYGFKFNPNAEEVWKDLKLLMKCANNFDLKKFELYIRIIRDDGPPPNLDDLIGKVVKGGDAKFGGTTHGGAVAQMAEYQTNLDRLKRNAKTATQSTITFRPTSKGTPTNLTEPSLPRTIASSSKSGDDFTQTTVIPVRKSARQSAISQEDLPRAPLDNTPGDKVILVWPYENFEGTGAVTITHADANRLHDGEYLNDTLIDYGLKKIAFDLEKRDPESYSRVHVFNSFFYKQLSVIRKGDPSFDPYTNVRKWTNKFNFFSKKFIIVPINEHMHWYLAIIVNPAAILSPSRTPRRATRASGGGEEFPAPEDIEIVKEALAEKEIATAIKKDRQLARESQPGSTMDVDDSALTAENSPDVMEGTEDDATATNSATTSENGEMEVCEQVQESKKLDGISSPKSKSRPITPPLPTGPISFQPSLFPPVAQGASSSSSSTLTPVPIAAEAKINRAVLDEDESSLNLAKALATGLIDAETCYIYTFDSLGGSHPAVTKKLREYLVKEAIDKLKKRASDLAPDNVIMKTVKVPAQPNFCDCGLYLLHYVEEFLGDPFGLQKFIAGKFSTAEMDKAWNKEKVLGKRVAVREEIARERVKWAAYRLPLDIKEAEEKAEKLKKKKAREIEVANAAKLDAQVDMELEEEPEQIIVVPTIEKEKEKEKGKGKSSEGSKSNKRKADESGSVIILSEDEEDGSSPAKDNRTITTTTTTTRLVNPDYDDDSESESESVIEKEEKMRKAKSKGKGKAVIQSIDDISDISGKKVTPSSLSSTLKNGSEISTSTSTSTSSNNHQFNYNSKSLSTTRVPPRNQVLTPPRPNTLSLPPTVEKFEDVDLTQDNSKSTHESNTPPPRKKMKGLGVGSTATPERILLLHANTLRVGVTSHLEMTSPDTGKEIQKEDAVDDIFNHSIDHTAGTSNGISNTSTSTSTFKIPGPTPSTSKPASVIEYAPSNASSRIKTSAKITEILTID